MVIFISSSTSTHNRLLNVNSREFESSMNMMGSDNPFSNRVYQELILDPSSCGEIRLCF